MEHRSEKITLSLQPTIKSLLAHQARRVGLSPYIEELIIKDLVAHKLVTPAQLRELSYD